MPNLPGIRQLNDFLPLVRIYAPGVSDPFAEQALRLAAIQFCERTRCWRHRTERTITRPEPVLVAPPYATIFEIETAAMDGHELTRTQYTALDLGRPMETGASEYIAQSNPGTVLIWPFTQGVLTMSMFLKPKAAQDITLTTTSAYDPDTDDDYNVVPDFLLVQHGEDIANGALARILIAPNQPFTDIAAASARAQMFQLACDTHFNHQIRGEQRAPARSRASFF